MENVTQYRAIVDTHCHPMGPKMQAKMAERGLYDPKQGFPQTNAQDLICYRECFDLDYAMPKQREGGVTLSLITNGGEVDWIARDLLQVSTGEALKFFRAVSVAGRHRNRLGAALADHLLDDRPTVLFERVCVGHQREPAGMAIPRSRE